MYMLTIEKVESSTRKLNKVVQIQRSKISLASIASCMHACMLIQVFASQLSMPFAAVNVAATMVAVLAVDHFGRKKLFAVGGTTMAACMVIVAATLGVDTMQCFDSPGVGMKKELWHNEAMRMRDVILAHGAQ